MKLSLRKKLLLLFTSKGESLSEEILDFITRVEDDGGVVESPKCIGVLDADFVMYPAGYKPTKVYSQRPVEVLGADEVVNGDFSNGSTDWDIFDATLSNETIVFDGVGVEKVVQTINIIAGKSYLVSFDIITYVSGDAAIYLGNTGDERFTAASVGTHSEVLIANITQTIQVRTLGTTFIGSIDNISVKEVLVGDGDFTMERNCTKYRTNKLGVLEEMGFNVLAPDYADGDCGVNLHEPESTNLYLNSELNNVENQTVTATPYTAFLYGTGTITFSGAFVGTLVGTGVNDKVEITFTPTAGTLTSTDSGSVDKKQLENLSDSTSYIKTQGASVTRFKDIVKDAGDVNSFNSEEGVLYVEMAALVEEPVRGEISLSDGTINNRMFLRFAGGVSKNIQIIYTVNGIAEFNEPTNAFVLTDFNKIAFKWKVNDLSFWINGIEVAVETVSTVYTPNTLNVIDFIQYNKITDPLTAKVKALKVFKTALTSQQLLELTTDGFVTTP